VLLGKKNVFWSACLRDEGNGTGAAAERVRKSRPYLVVGCKVFERESFYI